MSPTDASRTHKGRVVLIRFNDGEHWEEWHLRSNRGSKQTLPVKFFARQQWRSDNSRRPIGFAATSGNYASERDAEAQFRDEITACGGELLELTRQLEGLLQREFGHTVSAPLEM